MRILLIAVFCLMINNIYSQTIKPGISYTFITEINDSDRSVRYTEKTINLNISYQLLPAHKLGIQYLNISSTRSAFTFSKNKSNYFLAGVFYQ